MFIIQLPANTVNLRIRSKFIILLVVHNYILFIALIVIDYPLPRNTRTFLSQTLKNVDSYSLVLLYSSEVLFLNVTESMQG